MLSKFVYIFFQFFELLFFNYHTVHTIKKYNVSVVVDYADTVLAKSLTIRLQVSVNVDFVDTCWRSQRLRGHSNDYAHTFGKL